jgi:hypothetical protein
MPALPKDEDEAGDEDKSDEDKSDEDFSDEDQDPDFLCDGMTVKRIQRRVEALTKERDELTRVLLWMGESKSEKFDGTEFRIYEAITTLNKEPSKAVAAKVIAKLLGRDIRKAQKRS